MTALDIHLFGSLTVLKTTQQRMFYVLVIALLLQSHSSLLSLSFLLHKVGIIHVMGLLCSTIRQCVGKYFHTVQMGGKM